MTLNKELINQGNWLFRYRSYLPILIILPGLYLFLQADISELVHIQSFIAGLSVSMIGLVIRAVAVGYSAPNTSGRNTHGQVADTVNTKGIYSLCRHPLYLGNFMMWLGLAIITCNGWFCIVFVLLFWLYYERIMYAEEDYLVKKFGKEYQNWALRTPAFIPKFSNWEKSNRPYSWFKLLYQEKSTWLNLFLILSLFYVIKDMYENKPISIPSYISVITFIILLLYYIVLKTIQKLKD